MIKTILRLDAVRAATGLTRGSLYQDIKAGRFPRPVKITARGRAVGWLEEEVAAYQEARIAARDSRAA